MTDLSEDQLQAKIEAMAAIYAAHNRVEREQLVRYAGARLGSEKLYPLARLMKDSRAVYDAVRLVMQHGGLIAERDGTSRPQQYLDVLRLYFQYRMAPEGYYQFPFGNGRRRLGPLFVSDRYGLNVLSDLNRGFPEDCAILDDKVLFDRFCRDNELPTIPTFACIGAGREEWFVSGPADIPPVDLFAKPVSQCGGKGTRRWFRTAEGLYRNESDEGISITEVVERLRQSRAYGPLLLQERMVNHPDLETLCGRTFISIRLVTVRLPDDAVPVFTGRMTMPTRDIAASNLSADVSTFSAGLDVNSGVLTRGVDEQSLVHRHPMDVHPVTKQQIAGFQIPDWPRIIDLIQRAHRLLPQGLPFVGWDVGVTPSGPLLIEGNRDYGMASPQVANDVPLGLTAFPEYFQAHLEHRAHEPGNLARTSLCRNGKASKSPVNK